MASDDCGTFHDVVVGMHYANTSVGQKFLEMLPRRVIHFARNFHPTYRTDHSIPIVHELDNRRAMAFEIIYQDIGVEKN